MSEKPPRGKNLGAAEYPPDPAEVLLVHEMRKNAEDIYFGLAAEVRGAGMEPNDLEEWKEASTTYDALRRTIAQFESASPDERASVLSAYEELLDTLDGPVSERVGEAVGHMQVEGHPAASAERMSESEAVHTSLAETPAEPAEEESFLSNSKLRKPLNFTEDEDGAKPVTDDTESLREQKLAELKEKFGTPDAAPETVAETKAALRDAVAELSPVPDEEDMPVTAAMAKKAKGTTKKKASSMPLSFGGGNEDLTPEHADAMEAPNAELAPVPQVESAPQTPAAPREKYDMQEASKPYVQDMREAEHHYLDALKAYNQKRNIGSIALEQFAPQRLPKDVENLRKLWIAKRASYAGFMRGSATERLAERGTKLMESAVLERYQRRFIVGEVVLGAEEAELQAKMEGLSAREQGWATKAFENCKKLPPGVRIVGTSALFMGAGAALTGGAAIAAVPLALGGTSAALRWWAEKSGNKAVGVLARLTSVGALGGLIGEYGTRAVHKKLGTEEKAAERIALREGLGNLGSAAELDKLSRSRSNALTVKENIARQSRWGRIIGSLTGGALFGEGVHLATDAHDHADLAAGHVENHVTTAPAAPQAIPHAEAPAAPAAPAVHAEASAHAPAATQAPHEAMPHPAAPHVAHHAESASAHQAAEAPKEDDTALIMRWEKEYGGLPPDADKHIEEVVARLHQNYGPDAFKQPWGTDTSHADAAVAEHASSAEVAPATPVEHAPEPAPVAPVEHAPEAVAPAPEPVQPAAPVVEHPAAVLTPSDIKTLNGAYDQHVPAAIPQEPAHVSEVVVTGSLNAHGLRIDPLATHLYGLKDGKLMVFGGTHESQINFITSYLARPENAGKHVNMINIGNDPFTGKQSMAEFESVPGGTMKVIPVLTDEQNVPLAAPVPDEFLTLAN